MEKHEPYSIKETEAALLLRYLRGTASREEINAIENQLEADEACEKEWLQLARIFYARYTHDRIAARNPAIAFEKMQKRIKRQSRKIWLNRSAVAAACITGVIVLSTFLSNRKTAHDNRVPQQITIEATAGMRTSLNLPDGTRVYLNSGSVLSYPSAYTGEERHVTLAGEAYFHVTADKKHPFVVSVGEDNMRIRVVGTQFNVQAYKGDSTIQTTLVTGKVNLETKDSKGMLRVQALAPSEKAVYNLATGETAREKVNAQYETSWITGRLIFKEHTLPEVLKKLSYFYNVKFEVKDPVIHTYRFTGTFENRPLFQVLDYLKISSGIDYTIQHATDDSRGKQCTIVSLQKKK